MLFNFFLRRIHCYHLLLLLAIRKVPISLPLFDRPKILPRRSARHSREAMVRGLNTGTNNAIQDHEGRVANHPWTLFYFLRSLLYSSVDFSSPESVAPDTRSVRTKQMNQRETTTAVESCAENRFGSVRFGSALAFD